MHLSVVIVTVTYAFIRCYSDTDWYRTIVGTYEEREKILMSENNDLRHGLWDLQREINSVLAFNASKHDSHEVNASCYLKLHFV